MAEYRYLDANGAPLMTCPQCGWRLTHDGAVDIETTNAQTTRTVHAELGADGVLADPTREVHNGFLFALFCARCGTALRTAAGVHEQNVDGAQRVVMEFDTNEAKGKIELVRHGWGADLLVDGVRVCFIDLSSPTEGEPPQLIVCRGPGEEPLAKVVLERGWKAVVVHRAARRRQVRYAHAIHLDGDFVFESEPEPSCST